HHKDAHRGPRASGGGPAGYRYRRGWCVWSLRERGWTLDVVDDGRVGVVAPARAGVDRATAVLPAVENWFSRTFGESGPAVGGTPGGVVFRPGSTRCLFRYFLLLGSWSWSPWPLVRMGSRSTCVRSEGSFRAPTAAS